MKLYRGMIHAVDRALGGDGSVLGSESIYSSCFFGEKLYRVAFNFFSIFGFDFCSAIVDCRRSHSLGFACYHHLVRLFWVRVLFAHSCRLYPHLHPHLLCDEVVSLMAIDCTMIAT